MVFARENVLGLSPWVCTIGSGTLFKFDPKTFQIPTFRVEKPDQDDQIV